jgi:hypothetical protein
MEDNLIFLKNERRSKYFDKGKNSIFWQMKGKNMAVLGIGTAQALGFSLSLSSPVTFLLQMRQLNFFCWCWWEPSRRSSLCRPRSKEIVLYKHIFNVYGINNVAILPLYINTTANATLNLKHGCGTDPDNQISSWIPFHCHLFWSYESSKNVFYKWNIKFVSSIYHIFIISQIITWFWMLVVIW